MTANWSTNLRSWFHSDTWQAIGQLGRRKFMILLCVHFLICLWFSLRNDIMKDESGYYSYGIRWAKGHADRIEPTDDSKSPMVLPALFSTIAKPFINSQKDPHGFALLRLGKIFMYCYTVLAAFFTLLFLVKIIGPKNWLLPLTLFLFDPLVIGHAMVVGTDVASMAFLIAIAYTVMQYYRSKKWLHWVWCCVFTAMACITKSSMVFSVSIPLAAIILTVIPAAKNGSKQLVWQALKKTLLLVIMVWLVINSAYYFKGTFAPIGHWPQKSIAFKTLLSRMEPIHSWPSPFPYHYVSSFDELNAHAELGGGPRDENTYVGISVLQHFQTHGSVWYYYVVAFVVKWPLLIWLLLASSLYLIAKQFSIQKLYHWLWLWLPPLMFLVLMSLRNPFQIGIRHALLLYPFLYVIVGVAVKQWQLRKSRFFHILLALHFISMLIFWPNLIAYSNELIWPKTRVYRYINDSSIYYGQTQKFNKEFIRKHPDYAVPDSLPKAGKFAVPMEWIASDWDTWKLAWLKDNFEPAGLYLHTILLYHVSEVELQKAIDDGRIIMP